MVEVPDQISAGLMSSEGSQLGLHVATLWLCLHTAFSLCAHIPGVPVSSQDTSHIGLGLHFMFI